MTKISPGAAMVASLTMFFLTFCSAAWSEDLPVTCEHQYLEQTHQLSLKNRHATQYKALVNDLLNHKALAAKSNIVHQAFVACVKQYQGLYPDAKNTLSAELQDTKLSIHWGQNTAVVVSGNTSKLGSSLKKIPKLLKLSPEETDTFWFLWTESTIAATGNRFNYYIYADLMEYASLQSGGRSFAVGFTPKFAEEKMFVELVNDDKLIAAGLVAGSEIAEISSKNFEASGKFSWWLQQAPFKYAITFSHEGKTNRIEAQSVPFTPEEFTAQFWGDIAYIRFNSFNGRSSLELSRFVRRLNADAKGVIIDVRFNGGGVVNPGVPDFFLKPSDKVLVYKYLEEEQVSIPGSVAYTGLPLVVLQNRYSASMSEILVAALKAQNRATIIGEKSFGKGVGQTMYPVKKEGMVAIVETQYFYPDGKASWNETGIEPDIKIETTEEQMNNIATAVFATEIDLEKLVKMDTVLARAKSLLANSNK